jgi:hypothetical protein
MIEQHMEHKKKTMNFYRYWEWLSPTANSMIMVASHPIKQAVIGNDCHWTVIYCHLPWLPPSANSMIMVASYPIKHTWFYCH